MQHERIYRLQMWIKMQYGVFKISNNDLENVINPANLVSLRSTPPSSQEVDQHFLHYY